MRRLLKRLLTPPLLIVAGLVIVVEDFLWDPLQRLGAWLGSLPGLRRLEVWIAARPPTTALALFVLPSAALFPVKLLALYWVGAGHALLGFGTIVTAKIAGTAVVARLFTLTKPALLSVSWFSRVYQWTTALRDAIYTRVKGTSVWRGARSAIQRFKQWLARRGPSALARRWRAIRRRD